MGSPDVPSKVILLLIKIISISGLSITNGPQDTTVCMNAIAECDCGFSGATPSTTFPNWRIILRNDNGSVASDVTYNGINITRRHINGLQWSPDLTTGGTDAPNSKLLVGPVNKTHNQSSYQCVIPTSSGGVISSIGTMTVVGPPSVTINVDEICTTSITISLNTYSHPACGDVSHNVTISGNVIYPDTINGSKYTIDNLHSDTLYNITVTSVYNSGSKLSFTKSVRTSLRKSPNPIDATSINIEIENANCSYVRLRVIWKAPEVDRCSMLEVDHYDVMISSSKSERSQEKFYTNLFYAYLHHYSNTTITVSIAVVDTNGQRSDSKFAMKTIYVQNTIANDETVSVPSATTDGEDCSNLFVILTAVFLATSVIITTISVILAWKLWGQKKENDVVVIPAPVQSLRQLNVDNIEMQPSPAYVNLDNKRPRLYQNI